MRVEELLGAWVVMMSQSWLELVDPITEARSTPGGQQGPGFVGTYCSTWYVEVEIIRVVWLSLIEQVGEEMTLRPALFNTTTVVGIAGSWKLEAEARDGCGSASHGARTASKQALLTRRPLAMFESGEDEKKANLDVLNGSRWRSRARVRC